MPGWIDAVISAVGAVVLIATIVWRDGRRDGRTEEILTQLTEGQAALTRLVTDLDKRQTVQESWYPTGRAPGGQDDQPYGRPPADGSEHRTRRERSPSQQYTPR